MTTTAVDLAALTERFFALGAPPAHDAARPWRYRRRVTSLGWPAVAYLGALVETHRPARILDLGSGLTSLVLRSLSADVWTTDTSPGWLTKTLLELQREGLSTDRCYTQATFEQDRASRLTYDLISADIADTGFRRGLAPRLAGWLAPGGRIVLDDWHLPGYAEGMGAALRTLGFAVTAQPDTIDEFGRFVALATREAHGPA